MVVIKHYGSPEQCIKICDNNGERNIKIEPIDEDGEVEICFYESYHDLMKPFYVNKDESKMIIEHLQKQIA